MKLEYSMEFRNWLYWVVGFVLVFAASSGRFENQLAAGPVQESEAVGKKVALDQDWLIDANGFIAKATRDANSVHLENGLVRRTIRIGPNAATVGFDNLMTGDSVLRGVKPEARVSLNGKSYSVGGLVGQPNYAYLRPEWLSKMTADPQAFQFVHYKIGQPKARFPWKRKRHHAPGLQWPPAGVSLRLDFKPPVDNEDEGPSGCPECTVSVHYELYDGIPVICKWLTVKNQSSEPLVVDRFASEILAVVEQVSWVETREGVDVPHPESLHIETDFAFGGFNPENANRHVVHWRKDPQFGTQVNYQKSTPCLLEVEPTYGPAQTLQPGEVFTSCRTFELVYDSSDRERRGLALRRMYRTVAPWITENPLMHHLLNSNPDAVKRAIDQAAEVGFEMIILSFGSGFDMDNEAPDFLAKWKEVADHAHAKGIEIGSYSLLSSRAAPDGNMIVSPEGQRPTHGRCPALTSDWGLAYMKRLKSFYEKTGFDLLEHDGSYPGDVDVTERLPLQKGEQDSRWVQWRIISEFYQWCRSEGVYLNVPDYYLLGGSNKVGMGYREVNWSLPRAMQIIHTRQNIYDGTWTKLPSMGWMFVPLSQYHGGGAAATIEPLDQHLDHYRRMIDCNLGMGVQACYRGPRLFDTERTKKMVQGRVAWFKKYREVLESDVIHGRRADGRDLDWMLHVNPGGEHKGMLVVFNPTDSPIEKKLKVNLYYTGIQDTATLSDVDRHQQQVKLSRDYEALVEVSVPAQEMAWYVIETP